MSFTDGIVFIWIGFLIIGVTSASALLFWAIRTGQFGDQEHARSLPLLSEIPRDDGMNEGERR